MIIYLASIQELQQFLLTLFLKKIKQNLLPSPNQNGVVVPQEELPDVLLYFSNFFSSIINSHPKYFLSVLYNKENRQFCNLMLSYSHPNIYALCADIIVHSSISKEEKFMTEVTDFFIPLVLESVKTNFYLLSCLTYRLSEFNSAQCFNSNGVCFFFELLIKKLFSSLLKGFLERDCVSTCFEIIQHISLSVTANPKIKEIFIEELLANIPLLMEILKSNQRGAQLYSISIIYYSIIIGVEILASELYETLCSLFFSDNISSLIILRLQSIFKKLPNIVGVENFQIFLSRIEERYQKIGCKIVNNLDWWSAVFSILDCLPETLIGDIKICLEIKSLYNAKIAQSTNFLVSTALKEKQVSQNIFKSPKFLSRKDTKEISADDKT